MLLGDTMKFKSSVVAINSNVGKQHFSAPVSAIGRGRLDTLFHALLLVAGITLSLAAAAQAALDSWSAAIDSAQVAANRRGEIHRMVERTAFPVASTAHELPRSQPGRS
jgi:hypothetical protein